MSRISELEENREAGRTLDGETVGLVGCGSLGMAIAENLLKDGASVVGYRRSSNHALEEIGGMAARSSQEVAERAPIVFTCLPSDHDLEDVLNRPDGLRAGVSPGSVVVELSTLQPGAKRAARDALAECGATLLDAPVSASSAMVRMRKGLVLASGDRAAYERALPPISSITETVSYVGEFGSGSELKFLANILVAVNTAVTAEVVALARARGTDLDRAIEVLGASAGASEMFKIRAPIMRDHAFLPAGGSITTMLKDLHIIADFVADTDVEAPMLATVTALYEEAMARGLGNHDIAALADVLENPTSRAEPGRV